MNSGFRERFYKELKNLLRVWRTFVTVFRSTLPFLGRHKMSGHERSPIVLQNYAALILNICLLLGRRLVAGRAVLSVQHIGLASNRLIPW